MNSLRISYVCGIFVLWWNKQAKFFMMKQKNEINNENRQQKAKT